MSIRPPAGRLHYLSRCLLCLPCLDGQSSFDIDHQKSYRSWFAKARMTMVSERCIHIHDSVEYAGISEFHAVLPIGSLDGARKVQAIASTGMVRGAVFWR